MEVLALQNELTVIDKVHLPMSRAMRTTIRSLPTLVDVSERLTGLPPLPRHHRENFSFAKSARRR